MIVRNGRIVACTEIELYEYWLKRYADIMSYSEYKARMIDAGVKVYEENEQCTQTAESF